MTELEGTPGAHPPGLNPREALLALAAALALLLAVVALFGGEAPAGLPGGRFTWLALLELAALGPPLALPLVRRHSLRFLLRESLLIRPAPPAAVAGGLLLGAGLVLLAPWFEGWQARLTPPPPGLAEAAWRFARLGPGESAAWAFCCLAVAPSLLEEAFFRGLLLRPALERWSRPAAVAGIGLLFALFHLSPWHLPAYWLIGMLLTWAAARAGSVLPALALHLANNGLSLLAVNLPATALAGWVRGTAPVPPGLAALGAALALAGAALVRRSTRPGPA